MSTDSHGTSDQPTAPIPRTGRSDDPTQIVRTSGTASAPGPGRTQALPTDQPPTQALPTADARPTQAPPVDAPRAETPTDRGAGATTAQAAERPVSRTLRVGTVVWGLIIAIIGAGLVSVAGGARFDLELVLIGLLALAGVALVVGSLAVSMRRRR